MKRILFVLTLVMTALNTTFCSKQPKIDNNPLLMEFDTPYGVPPFDRIEAKHYEPAFEYAMMLHNKEVEAIVANEAEPTFENTILELDHSGAMLAQVSDIFGMMCASMNNEDMQEVQEEVMPLLAAHYDAISMNEALFKRIKAVYDKRNEAGLNAEQIRLVEKMYNSAVRQGALLNDEQKERLMAINEELSLLSVKFNNNLLAETNNFTLELEAKECSELPKSIREAAKDAKDDNKFTFTLHKPSLIPFLTYSKSRELREKIYKAYLNRCNNENEFDNKEIINNTISLRLEKANLLGYKSYADYVISEQMAQSPKAVYTLLEDIFTQANNKAKEELAEMNKMFKKDNPDAEAKFASWD